MVCVVLLQLLTIAWLHTKDPEDADSPVACAFAVITSLSAKPDTFVLYEEPELTDVVPI